MRRLTVIHSGQALHNEHRNSAQLDPGWRVIAGIRLAPDPTVDPSRIQARFQIWTDEQVIEPEAGVM